MKKLLLLACMITALFGASASVATADLCACGGATYLYWGPWWHQDSPYVPGHYDCIYLNPYSYVHGC